LYRKEGSLCCIEYMHTLPFEDYTPSGHYYLWQIILVDISKLADISYM